MRVRAAAAIVVLMATLGVAPDAAHATVCTVNWIGPSSAQGQWSNPAYWDTGVVPAVTDDVCIMKGFVNDDDVGATGPHSVRVGGAYGELIMHPGNARIGHLVVDSTGSVFDPTAVDLDNAGFLSFAANADIAGTFTNDGEAHLAGATTSVHAAAFVQHASAILAFRGPRQGELFPRLTIDGTATLDGELLIERPAGASPSYRNNASFALMSAVVNGRFASNAADFTWKNGHYYEPQVTGAGVTVTVRTARVVIPATVHRGATFGVSASTLFPLAPVEVWLFSKRAGVAPVLAWSGAADSVGALIASVPVPSTFPPGRGRIELRQPAVGMVKTKANVNYT